MSELPNKMYWWRCPKQILQKANRWPSFTLGGSLGLTSATLGKLLDTDTLITTLSAAVSHTLFDGGALDAQVDIQTEQEKQAMYSYKKTVLSAPTGNGKTRLLGCITAGESYAALNRALDASKNEEKLALMQYPSWSNQLYRCLECSAHTAHAETTKYPGQGD